MFPWRVSPGRRHQHSALYLSRFLSVGEPGRVEVGLVGRLTIADDDCVYEGDKEAVLVIGCVALEKRRRVIVADGSVCRPLSNSRANSGKRHDNLAAAHNACKQRLVGTKASGGVLELVGYGQWHYPAHRGSMAYIYVKFSSVSVEHHQVSDYLLHAATS